LVNPFYQTFLGISRRFFMDHDTWMKLDDIRTALAGSIGVLLVLADGLDGCTRAEALSGVHAEAYVSALSSAYHALNAIAGELDEALGRAGRPATGVRPTVKTSPA